MDIVVGKQAVYVRAAHVLSVQVIHGDVRIVLEDHAGHDLVAHLQILSGAVLLHILTHLHDLAGSLMAQRHGNQAEGILFELMGIRSADAAALHLYQHVVVSHLGDGEFFYVIMLQTGQHGHARRPGDGSGSRRSRGSGGPSSPLHAV